MVRVCGGRRLLGSCGGELLRREGLAVGGELGVGQLLHLGEDGLMLRFVVPGEREGVRVAIRSIGDRDHLMQVGAGGL